MRPVERKDWSIDIFVEYPVHVISVAVGVAVVVAVVERRILI